MALEHAGYLDLPAHVKPGGFDHAAVHSALGRLYVAHTANDALDVIDCRADRCVGSIPGLAGVAGALVSEEQNLVFTSNRGENTVGVFSPLREQALVKVTVGLRPNGLAFDPLRGLLLAANVGDAAAPESFTVSIVDVDKKAMIADVPVPGRTRWAVFDRESGAFYVNIADPPQIAVIESGEPRWVARAFPIPAAGPHGLDLDATTRRLFCACDAGQVIAVDAPSGKILGQVQICGSPDVIFFNPSLKHLYVAIGDPGVIEVLDTEMLQRVEVVQTERGAHTIAFDPARNRVFAFLPETHRAAIFVDRTERLSESEAGTKLAAAP